MPFKNTVIILCSIIAVVAGGFVISQHESPSEDINSPTPREEVYSAVTDTPTPVQTVIIKPTLNRPRISTTVSPVPQVSPTPNPEETPIEEVSPPENVYTISYTDSGYIPTYKEISLGTLVVFKNDSTSSMWPASNDHQAYTRYSNSGVDRCDSSPATIFDACGPIQPGESWSFQFNVQGVWRYYDYLLPTNTGTILVK